MHPNEQGISARVHVVIGRNGRTTKEATDEEWADEARLTRRACSRVARDADDKLPESGCEKLLTAHLSSLFSRQLQKFPGHVHNRKSERPSLSVGFKERADGFEKTLCKHAEWMTKRSVVIPFFAVGSSQFIKAQVGVGLGQQMAPFSS